MSRRAHETLPVVYLNGAFIPLREARVSVLDRGFLFGDGVYEVIPVFAGKTFREDEHLRRLQRSLRAVSLRTSLSTADWHAVLQTLLEKNRAAEAGAIYLQATRGAGAREHVYGDEYEATVFAMCKAGGGKSYAAGVKAITHEDTRWQRCDIKAITLLPNVLLRQKASQAGALEAILLRDGHVTEGAASNVFVARDGVIATPPKDGAMLPGVTRDLVLELARQAGLPCREATVSAAALAAAEEIWLTGATMGVAPVIELDGKPVADGKPGPYWRRIAAAYDEFRRGGVIP